MLLRGSNDTGHIRHFLSRTLHTLNAVVVIQDLACDIRTQIIIVHQLGVALFADAGLLARFGNASVKTSNPLHQLLERLYVSHSCVWAFHGYLPF